jgi:peptide/nickel transport system substrate-binding protein
MKLPPPAAGALGALLLLSCRAEETGPVAVSAIGGRPTLVNPNRQPLDAPSAFLMQAVAQGLVRFDAAGEIEPALAQRWILSDDGKRYIFRLSRAEWPGGGRVTAGQVALRLKAAMAPSSRNPLKPLLGAIDEVVAVSEVIEISLKSPRAGFLPLLAQPELGILRSGEGSGPWRAEGGPNGAVRLVSPRRGGDEPEEAETGLHPDILLRGERAAIAVARFATGEADLVLGGTLGDLPLAVAARTPAGTLVFDPAAGLFGLAFTGGEGPLAGPEVRQALSMAIDRPALVAALGVPGLQLQEGLFPAGTEGLQPALPPWTALPLAERRALAARTLAEAGPSELRVALPEGPAYRLLFAHLRRDWAAIGVRAARVGPREPAELRLVDEVAPAALASWYLRRFSCETSRICDPAADEMLAAARIAPGAAPRRALLANADRIIGASAPFIPLASPVRWSLVSPRLTGFRPNRFARHPPGELIRREP